MRLRATSVSQFCTLPELQRIHRHILALFRYFAASHGELNSVAFSSNLKQFLRRKLGYKSFSSVCGKAQKCTANHTSSCDTWIAGPLNAINETANEVYSKVSPVFSQHKYVARGVSNEGPVAGGEAFIPVHNVTSEICVHCACLPPPLFFKKKSVFCRNREVQCIKYRQTALH